MTKDKDFVYEYNPIKETVAGKAVDKVVWTTKAIKLAVEGLAKGLPLKTNPFCGKNTKLLKPDLVYRKTKEEIEDYIRCKQDPVYFASKCYLKNPKGGLSLCEMRDYQVDYLHHLQKHNFSILLAARQCGKCYFMLTNLKVCFNSKFQFDKKLENLYFYNIEDNMYELPYFELYNLFCKQTLIWKLKYKIYKFIYRGILCQKEKEVMNTGKTNIQNGL